MNINEIVKEANRAKIKLMGLNTEIKNKALDAVAKNIELNKEKIYEANKKDLEYAQTLVDTGKITKALISF